MASIVAFSGCTAGVVAFSAGPKEVSYSCNQRVLAGAKAQDSAWLQSGAVSSVGFQGVQLSSEPRRAGRKLRQSRKQATRCVAAAGSGAPLKVIISGAPASGKGTQCEGIVKQYGLTHISAGDLLRAEVAAKTEWGMKAKEYMDAGKLVPDEVVITMVKQRLQQQDAQEKGWLLDGYPRSASQAAALEAAGIRPDIFILLEVPDEILVERVAGRRLDPVTGRIYHLKFSPPETPEVAARLTLRSDDTEDKVKTRLATHNANVESVLSTYKSVTKEVNGHRNKDAVFEDINKLLQHALAERQKTNGTAVSSSKAAAKEGWRGVPTRLNQIPHSREIREYFYQDACEAVQRAVADGHTKMEVKLYIPEMNPEMDVYRIGTLMEFLREMTFAFANSGKRVKACVQGSMGAGVFSGMPLSLAGSRRIMEAMDWGEDGETSARIRFGAVGPKEVWDDDEVFVIMSPQNTVGNCVLDDLEPMMEKAKDKIVVIINPKLGDVPSASGVMQIQGREKRMAFSDSFFTCYNFRLLYKSTSFYPIIGALRMSYPGPYELWKRIDTGDQEEEYIQLEGQWTEEPKGAVLGGAFAYRPPPKVETPRQKLFGLF